MTLRKISAMILGLLLMTQVLQARNNAALFGVAAAAIAGAAIIANSKEEAPRRYYDEPRKRTYHKKKHHRKAAVVITDEMKIQKSLTHLEFYKGKIDGKINSYATRNAIKKMNKQYGISDGTTLDSRTWDQLLYLAELFTMDRDLFSEVKTKATKGKQLQTALKVYGAYDGKVDGIVGNGTRKSIAIYKKREGLTLTTSLSPNERYNLIDSAQKMNTEAIDEAIKGLSPISSRAPERKTVQEDANKERSMVKEEVQSSDANAQDLQQKSSDVKAQDEQQVEEESSNSDGHQKELNDMEQALNSIDRE